MYKKLFLTVLSIGVAFTAYGTVTTTQLERALYQKTGSALQLANWLVQLKRQEQLAAKTNYKANLPYTQASTDLLVGHQKTVYFKRLLLLNNLLAKKPALATYRFQTPDITDFVELSEDRMQAIADTLQGVLKPRQVSFVQPFVMALAIGDKNENKAEIWIDVTNRKIYLMSNNFYTSATTRYTVHCR